MGAALGLCLAGRAKVEARLRQLEGGSIGASDGNLKSKKTAKYDPVAAKTSASGSNYNDSSDMIMDNASPVKEEKEKKKKKKDKRKSKGGDEEEEAPKKKKRKVEDDDSDEKEKKAEKKKKKKKKSMS